MEELLDYTNWVTQMRCKTAHSADCNLKLVMSSQKSDVYLSMVIAHTYT